MSDDFNNNDGNGDEFVIRNGARMRRSLADKMDAAENKDKDKPYRVDRPGGLRHNESRTTWMSADGTKLKGNPMRAAQEEEFVQEHDSILDAAERMSRNAQNANLATSHAIDVLRKRVTDLKIRGQKMGGDINGPAYQELTEYIESMAADIEYRRAVKKR